MPVDAAPDVGRDRVVGKSGLANLADKPAILQETEVTRHTGLGNPEDAGQLGDVQPLLTQQPEQAQPDLVAEQPVEGGGLSHIYKSTLMYVAMASPARSRRLTPGKVVGKIPGVGPAEQEDFMHGHFAAAALLTLGCGAVVLA